MEFLSSEHALSMPSDTDHWGVQLGEAEGNRASDAGAVSLASVCSPFEFQDEYDKSQVDDFDVVDDLEWNRALDSIGSPRQGLSPEEIAYRWNQK